MRCRFLGLAAIVLMAAAPDARAMRYTLYTDVTIYQDPSGTLVDSDGHVRCVDYSGNITTGSVSIQLWITESGSTRGMITVNSTINDWRSTTWTGLNIPNCYTGQITATAGGVGQGAGSASLCYYGPPPPPPPPQTCNNATDGTCESPIVLDLADNDYSFSGIDDPVAFDLDADGTRERVTWTARGAPIAFLALDRTGNGVIDNGAELFGNHTLMPSGAVARNGFDALSAFDSNGDGIIDANDAIWPRLLLWVDANHDGVCQPGELSPLAAYGITALSFNAHWSGRQDANGNTLRYEALYYRGRVAKPYYDVYFLRVP
jgi:hypothetical protein